MSGKSFKELIIESIAIFKKNVISILLLTLLVFIPVSLANVYIADNILDDNMLEQFAANQESYINTEDYEKIAMLSSITKQISTYVIVSLVISLFALVGDIAVIKLVQDSTNNVKRSFMEVFEESIRLFPRVIWVYFIANLIIGIGLLLIIPGIFLYFLFAFTLHVTVLYKLKGTRAIQYGSYVARKNLLKVVGYALFNLGCSIIVSLITTMPLKLIQNEIIENIVYVIIQSFNSFILCIPTIVFTLLFLDMQKNVEENVNGVFKINYVEGQS